MVVVRDTLYMELLGMVGDVMVVIIGLIGNYENTYLKRHKEIR